MPPGSQSLGDEPVTAAHPVRFREQQPQDVVAKTNDPVLFSIEAFHPGQEPINYRWFANGQPIASEVMVLADGVKKG